MAQGDSSDDSGLDGPPPAPPNRIGKKSIQAMFDNKDADRKSSKRGVRQLTLQIGMSATAPTFQELWTKRFEAFRENFEQDIEKPFDIEDLIRFCIVITRTLPLPDHDVCYLTSTAG